MKRRMSRRTFLGAAGVLGLGGLAYGAEQWVAAPPLPAAQSFASALPDTPPVPEVPVVLLTNRYAQPDFSAYLAEILRAEGLLGWQSAPFGRLNATDLSVYSLVMLAPGPLTQGQISALHDYVAAGGNLLALRPDPQLATVLGVRFLGTTRAGDELRLDPRLINARGYDPGALQLHGWYDRLDPAGATVLARSATGDPLITYQRFGLGQACLWAFDLAHCIALLRQGNPVWINQERDGMEGVRSSDLFVDWIDLDRIAVPQADEHQRLFSAMIEQLAAPPLPRLWYFPEQAPATLVMTGDAHGSPVGPIEELLAIVERHGGSASIYYTPPPASTAGRMARKARRVASRLPLMGDSLRRDNPLPEPDHVAAWRDRGHEFGMHPYVEAGLAQGYQYHWDEFLKYGYGPLPPTVRTHRVLWFGWVENARVQARYGLRMNLDHYHSGGAVRRADASWAAGYLGGTGLPMRFVAEDGTLLSVYQQPTHLVDEHLINVFDTGHDMGLDGTAAAAITLAQLADSIQRYPAALGLQCHVDPFLFGGMKAAQVSAWLDSTLAYAQAHNLPIMSAERWLAFTEARAATRITQLQWDATQRRLEGLLEVPSGVPAGQTLLLPTHHAGADLRTCTLGGVAQSGQLQILAGRSYTAFTLKPGSQQLTVSYGL
ncbi:MAG: hypothetical protein AB4911_11280 [Oscillochloridaceae bacterium umkhey_bin13]